MIPREVGTDSVRRPALPSWATVLIVVAACVLGVLLQSVPGIVFAVVLVVVLLPLLNAQPSVWIGLAIALPWTSRLFTTTGIAPRVVDFLDFPLVVVAFLVAGLRFAASSRVPPRAHRRITWLLIATSAAIFVSWAFNDHFEPVRFIAGAVLALEPFLLLSAILLSPLSGTERRRLLLLLLALLGSQVLFSAASIAMGHFQDDVKGTLWEAGAGHHVSAGSLALGFFLLLGLRARTAALVAFGLASLGIMVAADAKQVLFVLPLAAIVLGLTMTRSRSTVSMIGGVTAGAMMAGAAVYVLLSYSASSTALEFIDNSRTEDSGKVAVVPALWTDISSEPATLVFGLGPGESVSRFAFLTTGSMIKDGSPVTVLGLHESRNTQRYENLALGNNSDKSSFTSAQSSVMGIVGDYGLAGVAAFIALIAAVIAALAGSTDRGLRSAALASWTMLLPLAVVFDWLEQPPFTLAVVAITGLALRTDAVMPMLPAMFFRREPARTAWGAEHSPTPSADEGQVRTPSVNGDHARNSSAHAGTNGRHDPPVIADPR